MKTKRCFVIQPFDRGAFDKRYNGVFVPAIKSAGLEPYRVDLDPSASIPIKEIESEIRSSEICLADVTTDNPNVWFELGFAIAVTKEVVLVCFDERKSKFPFDVQHRNIIKYKTESSQDFNKLRKDIKERIKATLKKKDNERKRDGPTRDPIIGPFLQVNLDIVAETILIVIGTSLGAERYDRIFAQLLKRILRDSNIEVGIITDALYHKEFDTFKSNPIICIGSRGTNSLVNHYEKQFSLKDRETTAKVFKDGQRPIAFIYGGGVRETYEATILFCERQMIDFVDQWSTLYTKGGKKVEIPSNIEDSLKKIISTMTDLGDN